MSGTELSLDVAYALETPEDSVRLYRTWAATYDVDFAERMDFQLPKLVAGLYAANAAGPVLDVGAGTGLAAIALAKRGVAPVDGIDISPEMLAVAATKNAYRRGIIADLTQPLPIPDNAYRGCVSSGTFTHGHVGPVAFDELLRVTVPGGFFAVSINPAVYETAGFAAKFVGLAAKLDRLQLHSVQGFGPRAVGEHRNDPGMIVTFYKT